MGLRAASSSSSSTSSSTRILSARSLPQQEDEEEEEDINNKTIVNNQNLESSTNESISSNMAPALTEPLSPTNKLSTSATSASPRPTSNNLLNSNTNSNNSITGDRDNQTSQINNNIINNSTSGSDSREFPHNSGEYFGKKITSGNSVILGSGVLNHNNNNSNKGAFQLAFEKVVAKQTAARRNKRIEIISSKIITTANQSSSSSTSSSSATNGPTTNIYFHDQQMGPMCDINNAITISSDTNVGDSIITTSSNSVNNNSSSIIIDSGDFIINQEEELLGDTKLHHMEEEEAYTNCDITDDSQLDDQHQDQIQQQHNDDDEDEIQHIQNELRNQEDNEDQQMLNENLDESDKTIEIKDVESCRNLQETLTQGDDSQEENLELENPMHEHQEEQTEVEIIEIGTINAISSKSESPSTIVSSNQMCVIDNIVETTNKQQIQVTPRTLSSIPTTSAGNTNSGMGLQKDFIKDSSDMEQVLGELTTTDMDLLQVLKGFDTTPGGEAALCDLAGSLGLFNDVDVMNYEEIGTPSNNVKENETKEIRMEIEKRQQQMQRKCDFLLRRLRKIQARYMGKHTSEEISGLFEWTNRIVRRKDHHHHGGPNDPGRHIITYDDDKHRSVSTNSMRTFLRRIDSVATAQHSNLTKQRNNNNNMNINNSNNIKIGGNTIVGSGHRSNFLQNQTNSTVLGNAAAINISLQQQEQNSPILSQNKIQIGSLVPQYDEKTTEEVGHVSGMLQTELKEVQSALDSDVTASSSGGESADEMVSYNNQIQQSLTIAKRAAWRWARDRSAIASRWTWLLAQISDLEYRIRQHNELHHQIKKNKGAVTFEKITTVPIPNSPSTSLSSTLITDQTTTPAPSSSMNTGNISSSVNGYRGLLPGNAKTLDVDTCNVEQSAASSPTQGLESPPPPPNGAYDQSGATINSNSSTNSSMGSCRTKPFQRAGFRKRKLLQTANVHTVSKKAARSSTVKCGCQWPLHPCALCTGRSDPTAPRDLPDTMTPSERVALLDPGFHAVLSFPEDVSNSIHFEATLRLPDWQNRVIRCSSKSVLKGAVAAQKAAEREDRSKKYLENNNSRRKYSRKYAQDLMAANKLKQNAKNRRSLHGGNNSQFNNHHLIKNKHNRKMLTSSASLSLNVGGNNTAINVGGLQLNNNSSYGGQHGIGGYDSANLISSDNHDNNNGSGSNGHHSNNHHLPRSKNSSPTPGSYSNSSSVIYKNERMDRRNRNSYDIDNIVIPYSVAAATRVEILPYKEIPTPKWRIIDEENIDTIKQENDNKENETTEEISMNNNINKLNNENSIVNNLSSCDKSEDNADEKLSSSSSTLSAVTNQNDDNLNNDDEIEIEDISYEAIQLRHERALIDERKKFQTYLKFPWSTRSRANRRIDSRAESSGANTPDPTSPAPNTPSVGGDQESIPSPAAPSTPQTPLEPMEGADINSITINNPGTIITPSNPPVSNNISNSAAARRAERKRTVSLKKERESNREEARRSNTPDFREIIPPFEPLQFPLPDDIYEAMLQLMPNDHQLLEDCLKSDCDGNTNVGDKDWKESDGKDLNTSVASGSGGGLNSSINHLHSNITPDTDSRILTSELEDFENRDNLMMGVDSDTDSAESGLADEDPNDPEWREPV